MTIRLFIVPPEAGCGWRIIATGARGRGAGGKRPSRRPSGPGKMTSGIILGGLARWRGKSSPLYKRRAPFRNLAGSSLGRSSLSGSRRHHPDDRGGRSEEHTSELQSLMRISYAVFCLKKKINMTTPHRTSMHTSQYSLKLYIDNTKY